MILPPLTPAERRFGTFAALLAALAVLGGVFAFLTARRGPEALLAPLLFGVSVLLVQVSRAPRERRRAFGPVLWMLFLAPVCAALGAGADWPLLGGLAVLWLCSSLAYFGAAPGITEQGARAGEPVAAGKPKAVQLGVKAVASEPLAAPAPLVAAGKD